VPSELAPGNFLHVLQGLKNSRSSARCSSHSSCSQTMHIPFSSVRSILRISFIAERRSLLSEPEHASIVMKREASAAGGRRFGLGEARAGCRTLHHHGLPVLLCKT